MNPLDLLNELKSGDAPRILEAAKVIIRNRYDRNFVAPLFEHPAQIKGTCSEIDFGGKLASNKRFLDCALKVIEFHRDEVGCACILNRELEAFDPSEEEKKGRVIILDTIYANGPYVDFYTVECTNCRNKYKVEENDYHYRYWDWQLQNDQA